MARLPIVAAREYATALLAEPAPRVWDQRCVCGADRGAHTGPTHTGRHPDSGCARFRADLAWDLAVQAVWARGLPRRDMLARWEAEFHQPARRAGMAAGQVRVSASDVGAGCRRKIWYRETPPEGFTPSPVDGSAAANGSAIHEFDTKVDAALHPWRTSEQRVEIPGLEPSSYDRYDPVTCEVEDEKTAGSWKWDDVGDHGTPPEWWDQLSLYALGLEAAGLPVNTLRLRVVERAGGAEEQYVRPYDRARALRARDALVALATEIENGVEQPRDRTGPTTDGLCRSCFARDHCWDLPQARALGRSGESVVHLGIAPDEAAVEYTIVQVVDANRAKTEAAKRADVVRADLVGIPPGVYGIGQVVPGARGNPNWKAYAEALRQAWDLPEGMRPDPDLIPVPTFAHKSPSARLLRKAERDAILAAREAEPTPGVVEAAAAADADNEQGAA
jgi:hypothetical protein